MTKFDSFQFLDLSLKDHILTVSFNRPNKANSLHLPAWEELRLAFTQVNSDPEIRVVILKGNGKHFCAGMDLEVLLSLSQTDENCEAKRRLELKAFITHLQSCVSAIAECNIPVIVSIHGACIGGGINIASACDMSYGLKSARFSIKEVSLGMVADLGVLQRLPRSVHPGLMADIAYTGREFDGTEAAQIGVIIEAFDTKDQLNIAIADKASQIAGQSPLVIQGIKEMLKYQADHTLKDSLNAMAVWNSAFLLSNDIQEAFKAQMEKRKPNYKNLNILNKF